MDVAVVIVNFRTPEATMDAVTTVVPQLEELAGGQVIVVDNDSGDGSFARLEAVLGEPRWHGRVTVLASGHNGGFGFGNNVGIRHVLAGPDQPRFFYLLNPDATIEPGALRRLLDFAGGHPDAGLIGNIVHDAHGAIQVGAFRFPSILSELEVMARVGLVTRALREHVVSILPEAPTEVDWVGGPSMLIRAEALSKVGLFDEKYFLYFEEIDFARRMWDAGWKVYFVPEAGVRHIGSLSTGLADEQRPMPAYWFESRRRYFVKHHGRLYGALCDLAWLSGFALFKAKTALLRRAETEMARPGFARSFFRYSLANFARPAPEAPQNARLPA